MPDTAATRFIGGSPLAVLVRLAVVSVIVGALMSWLGIDALDLVDDLQQAFFHLYGTGFAALRNLGQTALAGAAVVVPVWLILRFLSFRSPHFVPRGRTGATPGEVPRWGDTGRTRD